MHSLSTIELAAIRRAECLEYAERYRLAQRAATPVHGRTRWWRGVRDELTALRVRMSATRRPDLTPSTDLTTAAAETA